MSFEGVEEEEDDEPLDVPDAAELGEDGGVPDDEAEDEGDGDDGAIADDEEPDGEDGVVDEELEEDGGDGVVVDVVDDSRWQPAAPNTSAIPSTSESLRFNIGRTSNFGYQMATTECLRSKAGSVPLAGRRIRRTQRR